MDVGRPADIGRILLGTARQQYQGETSASKGERACVYPCDRSSRSSLPLMCPSRKATVSLSVLAILGYTADVVDPTTKALKESEGYGCGTVGLYLGRYPVFQKRSKAAEKASLKNLNAIPVLLCGGGFNLRGKRNRSATSSDVRTLAPFFSNLRCSRFRQLFENESRGTCCDRRKRPSSARPASFTERSCKMQILSIQPARLHSIIPSLLNNSSLSTGQDICGLERKDDTNTIPTSRALQASSQQPKDCPSRLDIFRIDCPYIASVHGLSTNHPFLPTSWSHPPQQIRH